jgi:hypothetical protein
MFYNNGNSFHCNETRRVISVDNMELTAEQKRRIAEEYRGFKEWLGEAGKNERADHDEHGKKIMSLVKLDKLEVLDRESITKLYDSLWASQLWSNKIWYVENKILPNGVEKLRKALRNLLYESKGIAQQYDEFVSQISGFGPSAITEILHFVYPDKYCLWNEKPKTVLPLIGVDQLPESYYKYQLKDGRAYEECIKAVELVKNELQANGSVNPDFIDADLFFWYLFNKFKKESKSDLRKSKAPLPSKTLASSYDVPFIPPVVANLEEVAVNENAAVDFEKKIGLLFKMLGYKVQQLGSGKGPVADVVAKGFGQGGQYAVIIDCKARSSRNYQINTSDQRALTDYAKSFFKEHENRGTPAHLLIVSSGFSGDSMDKIREIRRDSRIESVCLITAVELLFVLESKLKNFKIDVDSLKELFVMDGIISRERIIEMLPAE